MRLIDANAAYDILTAYYHQRTEIQRKALREALDRVPTAEPCNDAISRQAAINVALEAGATRAANRIKQLPSAQPEIIRCKDCKHHSHDAGYGYDWCNRTSGVFRVKPEDFCSYAERREE